MFIGLGLQKPSPMEFNAETKMEKLGSLVILFHWIRMLHHHSKGDWKDCSVSL